MRESYSMQLVHQRRYTTASKFFVSKLTWCTNKPTQILRLTKNFAKLLLENLLPGTNRGGMALTPQVQQLQLPLPAPAAILATASAIHTRGHGNTKSACDFFFAPKAISKHIAKEHT